MKITAPLAAAVFALLFPQISADAAGNDGSLRYVISGGNAVITGYDGEPENITVPASIEGCPVTVIQDDAFYCCKSLRSISFPDSLQKIGNNSFYGCSALESVDIPDSVTDIGKGSFCGCISLESISLPDSADTLPDSCFRSCTSLTSAVIPENITTIDKFCFSGCTSLHDVSLDNNLSCIGSRAFFMCSSLEKIYVPSSVRKIGQQSLGFLPDMNGAVVKADFTILGVEGSASERYAEKNGISFSGTYGAVPAFSPAADIPGKDTGSHGRKLSAAFFFAAGIVFCCLASKANKKSRRRKKRRTQKRCS